MSSEGFPGDITDPSPIAQRQGYIIRPARPRDRAAAVGLCARAWPHGEDYVPLVWDEWLADRQGALLVVEAEGSLAAIGKVTFLAPHEAWLEGLRVDPHHRRRGLAGWMLETCLAVARERGAEVVRFGTGAHNIAVHKTAARQEMRQVGTYAYFSAPPLPGAATLCTLVPADLPQVRQLLDHSATLEATHRLYETNWCWPELTAARLAQALQSGHVLGYRGADGSLGAVALVQGPGRGSRVSAMVVGLVAGRPADLVALCLGLRTMAASTGAAHVEAKLPELADLRQAALGAGFQRDEEKTVCIFEKRWP